MNTQLDSGSEAVDCCKRRADRRAFTGLSAAPRSSVLGVIAFVLAALVVALIPGPAHADDQIAAKIADVAQQLDTLENEQASADDALQSSLHLEAELDARLAQLRTQIHQAQQSRQEVTRQVNSIAATAYMSGQLPTAMNLVFSA